MMKEYEIFIEDINPCGGTQYAKKEIIEAAAESPEAWVRANGRFPIMETGENAAGDTVVRTGDGKGNFVVYTFSE